ASAGRTAARTLIPPSPTLPHEVLVVLPQLAADVRPTPILADAGHDTLSRLERNQLLGPRQAAQRQLGVRVHAVAPSIRLALGGVAAPSVGPEPLERGVAEMGKPAAGLEIAGGVVHLLAGDERQQEFARLKGGGDNHGSRSPSAFGGSMASSSSRTLTFP